MPSHQAISLQGGATARPNNYVDLQTMEQAKGYGHKSIGFLGHHKNVLVGQAVFELKETGKKEEEINKIFLLAGRDAQHNLAFFRKSTLLDQEVKHPQLYLTFRDGQGSYVERPFYLQGDRTFEDMKDQPLSEVFEKNHFNTNNMLRLSDGSRHQHTTYGELQLMVPK